jgi:hypothetical protein
MPQRQPTGFLARLCGANAAHPAAGLVRHIVAVHLDMCLMSYAGDSPLSRPS